MIITIKNLQQQTFKIDFQPEKTVLELKKQIYEERGREYVVDKQKLIYAGVILDDERTIASYNVDEKKFVVVMLKREIGSAVPSKPEETDSSIIPRSDAPITSLKNNDTTSTSGVDTNEKQSKSDDISSTNLPECKLSDGSTTDSVLNTVLQSRAESNLLMGDEYNRSVDSMIEMGYSRELVERAMSASFNNPERAVEYLISGIPENGDGLLLRGDNSSISRDHNQSGNSGTGNGHNANLTRDINQILEVDSETTSTEGSVRNDPFEFLRNQPQFLQMRSLVYQNPDLLQAVLQQIGQTNPALLQLISENQDAFLNMLNHPIEGESSPRHSTQERHSEQLSALNIVSGRENIDSDNAVQQSSVERSSSDSERTIQQSSHSDQNVHNTSDTTIRDRTATTAAIAALTAAASAAIDRGTGSGQREIRYQTDNSVGSDVGVGEESERVTIRLSPQEREAIERLKALGFPEGLVLQAYFACEKDEQLAANFLISSAFDD